MSLIKKFESFSSNPLEEIIIINDKVNEYYCNLFQSTISETILAFELPQIKRQLIEFGNKMESLNNDFVGNNTDEAASIEFNVTYNKISDKICLLRTFVESFEKLALDTIQSNIFEKFKKREDEEDYEI